jgi:hypothetical protein
MQPEPVEIVTLDEVKKCHERPCNGPQNMEFPCRKRARFCLGIITPDSLGCHELPRLMAVKSDGYEYYGPEAYPLYRRYSTKVVAHTLKVYSKHTIPLSLPGCYFG